MKEKIDIHAMMYTCIRDEVGNWGVWPRRNSRAFALFHCHFFFIYNN